MVLTSRLLTCAAPFTAIIGSVWTWTEEQEMQLGTQTDSWTFIGGIFRINGEYSQSSPHLKPPLDVGFLAAVDDEPVKDALSK